MAREYNADRPQVIDSKRSGPLRDWVLRVGDGTFASASGPRAMARMLGTLFVAGATIATATLAFHQPPGTNVPALAGVFAAAYAIGGWLLVRRDRIGAWTLVPALAAGTVV